MDKMLVSGLFLDFHSGYRLPADILKNFLKIKMFFLKIEKTFSINNLYYQLPADRMSAGSR
jgi:hypothetical protein